MVSAQTKNLLVRHHKHTMLGYGRINKKLGLHLDIKEIDHYLATLIAETPIDNIIKQGKNYYVSHLQSSIKITINSFTYSIITVDRL